MENKFEIGQLLEMGSGIHKVIDVENNESNILYRLENIEDGIVSTMTLYAVEPEIKEPKIVESKVNSIPKEIHEELLFLKQCNKKALLDLDARVDFQYDKSESVVFHVVYWYEEEEQQRTITSDIMWEEMAEMGLYNTYGQ